MTAAMPDKLALFHVKHPPCIQNVCAADALCSPPLFTITTPAYHHRVTTSAYHHHYNRTGVSSSPRKPITAFIQIPPLFHVKHC